MFNIRENLKRLPDKPGVYLHKDAYGEILYVGKAASLRSRVRQYFGSARGMDAKVRAMVSHISEFEYITTDTEMEALILENNLIKKHLPRYNVLLRDDTTYPYIKLTLADAFPRLIKTRVVKNDGSRYFGPYADVGAVNRIIDLLNDVYRLKRCSADSFPAGHRPCLHRDIKRCRGVCEGRADREAYREAIAGATAFLNGRSREFTDALRARMERAAAELDYETAALYRDYLEAARSVIEKQRVVLLSGGDIDIVLSARGEKDAHVVVFFVRDGRLNGRESHHLQSMREDPPAEVVSAFLKQYYINRSNMPREIWLDDPLPDGALIGAWLSALRGAAVRLHVPLKGEKKALLDMAKRDLENTARLLDEKAKTRREKDAALRAAFLELLGAAKGAEGGGGADGARGGGILAEDGGALADGAKDAGDTAGALADGADDARAWRIEAYDISNTGGVDSVGAMAVFYGTKSSGKDYRRFRIRTAPGADDYSGIQEVLYRRLKRMRDGDAGFSPPPDLILIDGGLGHVNAALQILRAMKLDIAVAGMVKDDRHRTRGLVLHGREFDLKSRPLLYHFTGKVQEEVHRFAIEYHRGARGKAMLRSELDEVPGIGPKRRNALLAHFGGTERIKAASEEELSRVPGMTRAAARGLRAHFSAQGREG
ncbi:MAG: excinuclease ABC subunit UvrC [Clostridiales Family XIII bacterium]|jgi:excinuclease ABC subunit C|nr:excinuclease ABC subunit UvrC [Clostridiales Family XIII bacterium]